MDKKQWLGIILLVLGVLGSLYFIMILPSNIVGGVVLILILIGLFKCGLEWISPDDKDERLNDG